MPIHTIAVLGAGNGGCAAAADLTMRGYHVRLYSRSSATLDPIRQRGGIEIIEGNNRSFAEPELVTSDLAEAVAGADLVMITAPSVGHGFLAAGLARHLREQQIVLLNPGHTGGALHVMSVLRQNGVRERIRSCETVTLTYICRMPGPARVEIYRRTTHLRCAAFPAKFAPDILREVGGIYPNIVAAENVMETGLSNINAIMHPAGMVGNAGWIERSAGDFYFYREGITPAIANIISAVDRERLEIVRKLGLPPLTFNEIFCQAGLTSATAASSGSVYRAIKESAPNQTIKSPATLNHRYLHEDVGYGLVPMEEIGSLLGVECPVIGALITLASEMNDVDYRREGLTLKKMGLEGIEPEGLPGVLHEGFD
ncbi:MAG: NAD/NADP octopine/nopaline dehydrogenase family protein [Deltaproteobacteria bacterium]|nr:NAD/NADP octopine/nopaline dehydrogenase family protein [Deltaproteobacteria bacterium]